MNNEEIYNGLVNWLKECRDANSKKGDPQAWNAIDVLLDEVRDAGAEGLFPWQR